MARHPEDELFVPFYGSDGSLLGIFSVGEPRSGRRPSDEELDVLVAMAEHAAAAVERLSKMRPSARSAVYTIHWLSSAAWRTTARNGQLR